MRRADAAVAARSRALAARYDIGFNIDAEEADRLELSLDLFERWPPTRRSRRGTASASSCRPIRSVRGRASTGSSHSARRIGAG